ncbi:MAG TPA: tetratricopeptide repeat protein [Gemmatimonadaceae bacterium]
MSLINDAMKAAQRERDERVGRSSPPLARGILSYASEGAGLPRGVVLSLAVLAVIASAGTALVVLHGFSPARAAEVIQQGAATKPKATAPPAPEKVVVQQTSSPKPPPVQVASSPPAPPQAVAATDVVSPPTAQPTVATAQVHLEMDQAGSRPADSLARLAYAEHVKSNVERARNLYEKAIATKQAPAEAFNDYGVLLAQQGNPTMASEMFRQAIARDEFNVDAWVNLGDSFVAAGHHDSALSAFDRARQLDPSSAAIRLRLANEHLEVGDTTVARRIYEEVVSAQPDNARAHHAYGSLLQAMKDYRGAIREFSLFVASAERSPGEFTPEKIAEMRRHVASLRRVAP